MKFVILLIVFVLYLSSNVIGLDQTGDLSCLGLVACPTNGNCVLSTSGQQRSAWYNKCNATLNFQLLDDTHDFAWLRLPPLEYPNIDSFLPYAFDYTSYGIGSAVVSPPAKPLNCALVSSYDATLMNRCQVKLRVLVLQYCTAPNFYDCKPTPPARLVWVDMYGAEVGSSQNLIPDVESTSTYCPATCISHALVVGQQ